jgi:hypothetical protein
MQHESEIAQTTEELFNEPLQELDAISKEFDSRKGELPPEGISRIWQLPIFQKQFFFLILGCTLGIFIQWFLTSELFDVPVDVSHSRQEYILAKTHYEKNRDYWDTKQNNLMESIKLDLNQQESKKILEQLNEASSEIFISFLVQNLNFYKERLNEIAVFPKKSASSFSIILSKYEKSFWPIKIMLSLELEIKVQGNAFAIEFVRLRRGARDVSLGLAWTYFWPELEPLQELKLLSHPIFYLPRNSAKSTNT